MTAISTSYPTRDSFFWIERSLLSVASEHNHDVEISLKRFVQFRYNFYAIDLTLRPFVTDTSWLPSRIVFSRLFASMP